MSPTDQVPRHELPRLHLLECASPLAAEVGNPGAANLRGGIQARRARRRRGWKGYRPFLIGEMRKRKSVQSRVSGRGTSTGCTWRPLQVTRNSRGNLGCVDITRLMRQDAASRGWISRKFKHNDRRRRAEYEMSHRRQQTLFARIRAKRTA